GGAGHERAALSGRHDFRHAEGVGADVTEHSGCRALIAMTERTRGILDQWDATRGAQASDLDHFRTDVTREIHKADRARLRRERLGECWYGHAAGRTFDVDQP